MTPEQKEKIHNLLFSFIKGRWFFIVATVTIGAISKSFEAFETSWQVEYFLYLAAFVFSYNLSFLIILRNEFLFNKLFKYLTILNLLFDVFSISALIFISSKNLTPLVIFYIIPIIEATLTFKIFGFILTLILILTFYNTVVFLAANDIIFILINNFILLLCAFFSEFILLHVTQQEQKLIMERNEIRTLLKNLSAGLILVDNTGKIIFSNPCAENFLNITHNDILGLDINSKEIEKFPHLKSLFDNSKKYDTKKESQFNLDIKKEGKTLYLRVNPVFIEDEHHHYIGIMYVLEDLSREKLLSDIKTEFISLAAHQLRTPLSAIKWLLRMLLTGDLGALTEEQKEYIKKGYDTNEKLIELVKDLLDVSRIEEGRFGFNFKKTNIKEIVEKIVPQYIFKAQEKDIHFSFNEPTAEIPEVMADEEKITIVVQNLLDNAFKYTKASGNVILALVPREKEVEISVSDDGIGIPDEEKNKIFSKFFRGYNALRSNIEGTGLGLFIVKNIVDKHGGKIWFESKLNKGSTFYFTIPYAHTI